MPENGVLVGKFLGNEGFNLNILSPFYIIVYYQNIYNVRKNNVIYNMQNIRKIIQSIVKMTDCTNNQVFHINV